MKKGRKMASSSEILYQAKLLMNMESMSKTGPSLAKLKHVGTRVIRYIGSSMLDHQRLRIVCLPAQSGLVLLDCIGSKISL